MKNCFYCFILFFYLYGTLSFGCGQDSTYIEKEMMLDLPVSSIYGTFLQPRHQPSFPCVLVIAGSGPTDRDGNSSVLPGDNNSLKMLTESLAIHGIASLRYDKRGIGASRSDYFSETTVRFEDYIHDAALWIEKLRANDSIGLLGIIGHSEGSLIGMVAAKRAGAYFFISINGAGKRADSIILDQLKNQPKDIRITSSSILEKLVGGTVANEVPPALNSLFRPSVQPYLISWFQYDPQVEFSSMTMPSLLVHGKSDLQVETSNLNRLLLVNQSAKYVFIDHMNHVLKPTGNDPSANFKSYYDPNIPISKDLIDVITEFILSLQ